MQLVCTAVTCCVNYSSILINNSDAKVDPSRGYIGQPMRPLTSAYKGTVWTQWQLKLRRHSVMVTCYIMTSRRMACGAQREILQQRLKLTGSRGHVTIDAHNRSNSSLFMCACARVFLLGSVTSCCCSCRWQVSYN
jgi:hypothetical protein